MEQLTIVKIGGNIIDDDAALASFLHDFASLPGKKILVHGGGKLATQLSTKLNIETTLIDGRRITDAETLRVITMVYAGWINKTIVAQLQANGCHALGLCGADGNVILASKRNHATIDYGFVGDSSTGHINMLLLSNLLETGLVPVIAPVTHDGKGQLLNTNADTIASLLASALCPLFETRLVYCFEKEGVLLDPEDDRSVMAQLDAQTFDALKSSGQISKGMIPKLENAYAAKQNGVSEVVITHARNIAHLGLAQKTVIVQNALS